MAKVTDKKKHWVVVLGFSNNDYLTIPCEHLNQAAGIYGAIDNVVASDPPRFQPGDWMRVMGADGFQASFSVVDLVWVRVEEQTAWDDIL